MKSSFGQAKAALVEALAEPESEDDEEMDDDAIKDDDGGSSESADDDGEKLTMDASKELPTMLFPNRPVTKEASSILCCRRFPLVEELAYSPIGFAGFLC